MSPSEIFMKAGKARINIRISNWMGVEDVNGRGGGK